MKVLYTWIFSIDIYLAYVELVILMYSDTTLPSQWPNYHTCNSLTAEDVNHMKAEG